MSFLETASLPQFPHTSFQQGSVSASAAAEHFGRCSSLDDELMAAMPLLAAAVTAIAEDGRHELYGMRLCLAWLESRLSSDPEAQTAIELLRHGEENLRRLFAEAASAAYVASDDRSRGGLPTRRLGSTMQACSGP